MTTKGNSEEDKKKEIELIRTRDERRGVLIMTIEGKVKRIRKKQAPDGG